MTIHAEIALFFVEGETEVEFYKKILSEYFQPLPKRIINLRGNSNIPRKVLGHTDEYLRNNKKDVVRVYCCVDREDRYQNPPLDVEDLERSLKRDHKKRVLSAGQIIATQMIESWFFHDIDGIYKFLNVPKAQRRPRKYVPVNKFNHLDLASLFERYGKLYIKGKKCKFFLEHLDLVKIHDESVELQTGLQIIKT